MKISTKGEYALRAMLDLVHQGEGPVVKLEDIANRQNISINYLERIFGRLRKAKIIASLRGPAGGYNLNKPANEIKVIDILIAAGDKPFSKPRAERSTTIEANKVKKFMEDSDEILVKMLNKNLTEL